jgi:hypothetical protein
VTHHDLGCEDVSHVRGSPFEVRAADPWKRHRVLGPAPSQRKSPSLLPVAGQLLLFGGDKNGPYTLNTSAQDWRWAPVPLPDGRPKPPDRTLHGAALAGERREQDGVVCKSKMVVFAGISLADQTELADVWVLEVRSWVAAKLVLSAASDVRVTVFLWCTCRCSVSQQMHGAVLSQWRLELDLWHREPAVQKAACLPAASGGHQAA